MTDGPCRPGPPAHDTPHRPVRPHEKERQLSDLPLAERLEALLRDHFEIEPERLRPEATFAELEMDSLAMVEVLAILEDEEDVRLPDGVNGLTPRTTLAEGFRLIEEAVAETQGAVVGGAGAGATATAGTGVRAGTEAKTQATAGTGTEPGVTARAGAAG